MIPTGQAIEYVRELLLGEMGELSRVVLASPSAAEANLALGLLAEHVAERTLVHLVNLREILVELPVTPMPMPLDFSSLAKAAGLERAGLSWERYWEDDDGAFGLVVLGEGNMCYDIVVRSDGESAYWTEHREGDHHVHPKALDLIAARPELLTRVVELVQAMGLPFNPKFYLSLEDFRLEYAEDSMDDLLHGLF